VRPAQPLVATIAVAGAATAAASGVLVANSAVLASPQTNGAYRAVTIVSWVGVGLLTGRLRPGTRYGLLLALTGFAFGATSLLAFAQPAVFTLGRVAWACFAVLLLYVVLSFPHGRPSGRAAPLLFRAFSACTAALWTLLVLGAPQLPTGAILARCAATCPDNPFQVATLGDALATVAEHGAIYLTSAMLVAAAALLARQAVLLSGLERATLLSPLACLVVFALTIAASTALRSASGDDDLGAALVLGWIGLLAALALPYGLVIGQARGRLFSRTARLAAANRALEAELRASAAELRASRARIYTAGEQERRRIERDLHDSAQNRLVALRVKLRLAAEGAADGATRDQLRVTLDALGEEAQDALDAVRTIARGIYPPLLATHGLGDALEAEADGAALAVRIVGGDGLPRSAPDVESALYFCCLEAIQNACKHAGRDARVTVRLDCEDDRLTFSVEDDGVGFALVGVGEGLTNMHDRVAAVGGEVVVVSERGRGTVVQGSAPWPARAAGA
jgi:signal transduction histidine kinase